MSEATEESQQIDEMRQRIANLSRRLEDSEGREKQQRDELITADHNIKQMGLEIERLKKLNNNACDKNHDLDGELDDYKAFVQHVVRDLGFEQLPLRDLRNEIKKRCAATSHESLQQNTVIKVKRILDPANTYEDIVQAAKAAMRRGPTPSASPSGELAKAHKDLREKLMNVESEKRNLQHELEVTKRAVNALEEQLAGEAPEPSPQQLLQPGPIVNKTPREQALERMAWETMMANLRSTLVAAQCLEPDASGSS
ncbi:MAG: hypothetical protein ACYTG5_13415 [Planctomycetota bacterium]|jgi:DNA repair exonuclease SbcCD ATPase subunit